jgi:type IV secretion system protein VirB6
MGFFSTFWNLIQRGVLNTVSTITNDIASSLEPAAVTFATIYVMIWGYLHMRGAIEEPILDGAKRILVMVVILGVSLHLWSYNAVFVDFFINTPQTLSGAILSGDQAVTIIDKVWLAGSDVADSLVEQGGIFGNSSIGFYIAGFLVYIFTGLVTVWMAFLFSLSLIGVGILLAVGPLFILGLLFDTTKRFFEAWVAQLSNYALIIILASIASKLLLNFLDAYATQAQQLGAAVTTAQAMQFCLACGFIFLIMKQVPSIAAGLASGIALSTFNTMSRAMNWSKGSTGRTMYNFGRGVADGYAGEKPSRYLPSTRNMGNRIASKVFTKSETTGGKIAREKVF